LSYKRLAVVEADSQPGFGTVVELAAGRARLSKSRRQLAAGHSVLGLIFLFGIGSGCLFYIGLIGDIKKKDC